MCLLTATTVGTYVCTCVCVCKSMCVGASVPQPSGSQCDRCLDLSELWQKSAEVCV